MKNIPFPEKAEDAFKEALFLIKLSQLEKSAYVNKLLLVRFG